MRRQLSAAPELNAPFQQLLEESIRTITALWPGPGRPRLLLMGSGAVGEACGLTTAAGEVRPLSDLDLALIAAEDPGAAFRARFTAALDAHAAALGLTHNPIELGILPERALPALPRTLELLEAIAAPVVLLGEEEEIRRLLGEPPGAIPPFEILRLVCNRVIEAHVHAEGEADPPGAWPAEPDWADAHRWSKLILDLGKAELALEGRLVARVGERIAALRALGRSEEHLAPIAAWSAWRAAPHWPPPAVPDERLVAWIRDLITRSAEAWPRDLAACGRILRDEGDTLRLRLHCWRRMVAGRPAGWGRLAALIFARRWVRHARPSSLAAFAYALGRCEPGGVAARIAALLPTPRTGVSGPRDAMIRRRLADLVRWSRAVGV